MFQILIHGLLLGFISSPTCPSNAEEVRWGAGGKFLPAFLVGVGAVAGDALVLLLVALGLYPLLQALPQFEVALWFLASLVLGWIGVDILREALAAPPEQPRPAGEPQGTGDQAAPGLGRPLLRGLLITALNPFTVVWWIGLLGTVTLTSVVPVMLFTGAVLIGSLAWFSGLAAVLHFGGSHLGGAGRRFVLSVGALALFAYATGLLIRAFSLLL